MTQAAAAVLELYHKHGAHLVLVRGKKPFVDGWKERGPSLAALERHVHAGGDVGIIPGLSTPPLAVVDVDEPWYEPKAMEALGPPLASIPSETPGRCHLYYPVQPGEIKNCKWAGGEIRGTNGQAVLYRPQETLQAFQKALRGCWPVDLSKLPGYGVADPKGDTTAPQEGLGGRNNQLNRDAFTAALQGQDREVCYRRLLQTAETNGLLQEDGQRQFDATFASGWEKGVAQRQGVVLQRGLDDWRSLPQALGLVGVEIRRNVRRGGVPEWRRNPAEPWRWPQDGGEWRPWLRGLIAERCKIEVHGKSGIELRRAKYTPDAFNVAWNTAVLEDPDRFSWDPFLTYLEQLPPWDGKERLERMFIYNFGAEDNPFTRWAGRTTMMTAVVRAFWPGYKVDECVVLYSPQGYGKSSIYAHSLPNEGIWQGRREQWFSDGLDFSSSKPKEWAEATIGRVICEAPDIAGADVRKIDRLKAWLSSTSDASGIRLAYRQDPEDSLRRAAIYASTNDPTPLPNDPTGNRRFVVVELKNGCDCQELMDVFREQLWAEALARVRAGQMPNLPRELLQAQSDVNERWRAMSDVIDNAVGELHPLGRYALKQVMQDNDIDSHRERELAGAMRKAGWRPRRVRAAGGGTVRRWVHEAQAALPPAPMATTAETDRISGT